MAVMDPSQLVSKEESISVHAGPRCHATIFPLRRRSFALGAAPAPYGPGYAQICLGSYSVAFNDSGRPKGQ